MTAGSAGQSDEVQRYPLQNADACEATRLGRMEALGDPITKQWLSNDVGLAEGWHCVELGAGAGSVVRYMADHVGPRGSVTAVERDASQLRDLARLANVVVVERDLCAIQLRRRDYDLVHSRSVLMHLDCAESVVRRAVAALRPGGIVFFEETDGSPALEVNGVVPEAFQRVMVPLAARWNFAPRLVPLLESLDMDIVRAAVQADPLVGGAPVAAFWQHTLASISQLNHRETRSTRIRASGFEQRWLDAMSSLLDDPNFSVPFTARHRVVARRPSA